MQTIRTLFFGSAPESLPILEILKQRKSASYRIELVGVVTQPPRPVGRKKEIVATPPQRWAEKNTIPVLSFASQTERPWLFENEQTVIDSIQPLTPDLIVVTYYGQRIPFPVIQGCQYGGLNIHPSLLPRWRGADPIPWAILWGDHQVGITVVTLAETFDEGLIIGQKKLPLLATDTTESLYPKLFQDGAVLLSEILDDYLGGRIHGQRQGLSTSRYARRLTREDGFIPWNFLKSLVDGVPSDTTDLPSLFSSFQSDPSILNASYSVLIDRMYRALNPWPGLWTTVITGGGKKRLKLVKLHPGDGKIILDQVQMEGKTPTSFSDFQKAYLPA